MAKRPAVEISDSKKRPCRVQTTVFKYFQLSSSQQQSSPDPSPTPCAKVSVATAPQAYGIHCFTEDEIRSAKGLQKTFRKFWNTKANELCASKEVRAKLQHKNAIQGAIYASWALEKTSHLQILAEGLEEDTKTVYEDEVEREHILIPMNRNLKRMLQSYAYVNHLYETMHTSCGSDAKSLEEALDKELTELRKAQEALHKVIKRRQLDIAVAEREQQTMTVPSPLQLSDDDVEKLVEVVITEEQNEAYDCDITEA